MSKKLPNWQEECTKHIPYMVERARKISEGESLNLLCEITKASEKLPEEDFFNVYVSSLIAFGSQLAAIFADQACCLRGYDLDLTEKIKESLKESLLESIDAQIASSQERYEQLKESGEI